MSSFLAFLFLLGFKELLLNWIQMTSLISARYWPDMKELHALMEVTGSDCSHLHYYDNVCPPQLRSESFMLSPALYPYHNFVFT